MRRLIDLAVLVMLAFVALQLKTDLERATQPQVYRTIYALFLLEVFTIEEEVRCAVLYYINQFGAKMRAERSISLANASVADKVVRQASKVKEQAASALRGRLSGRRLLSAELSAALWDTLSFCRLHGVDLLTGGYVLTTLGCLLILHAELVPPQAANLTAALPPLTDGRRLLGRGDSTVVTIGGHDYVYGDQTEAAGAVWLLLSSGFLLLALYNFTYLCSPFERLNIFLISTGRMLQRDLAVFLVTAADGTQIAAPILASLWLPTIACRRATIDCMRHRLHAEGPPIACRRATDCMPKGHHRLHAQVLYVWL